MNMHRIDYRVDGSDMQLVEITLQPGAAAVGEPGAMMYVDQGMAIDTVLGDGSLGAQGFFGRLLRGFKRLFAGESIFTSVYANTSSQPLRVAFAAPGPGKIIAVDLGQCGGELICQKGAFLAAARGVELGIAWQKRLRVGFLGGEGFVMQRLKGDGVVFVHASGALTETDLAPGQGLQVDSGCLVALQPSVSYDVRYAGKAKTALFGGEGLFYATLTGPGTVWLQSLPLPRLAKTIMANAFKNGTRSAGGKLYLLLVVIFVLFSIFSGLPE